MQTTPDAGRVTFKPSSSAWLLHASLRYRSTAVLRVQGSGQNQASEVMAVVCLRLVGLVPPGGHDRVLTDLRVEPWHRTVVGPFEKPDSSHSSH